MSVELLNIDCMEYMVGLPDKAFDLAIVDPPYGIGAGSKKFINGSSKSIKKYFRDIDWDSEIPNPIYFKELKRVSNNYIVWGGNYFIELWDKPCRGFIIWDKTIHGNSYSDCEFAYTSFNRPARYFRENIVQSNLEGRIHPTQKSIKIYNRLLDGYAKDGDRILDTHLGSGSSAIAAHKRGFDFVGCEIDKDYYEAACKRFKEQTMQQSMF